jgi:hypothetical protein
MLNAEINAVLSVLWHTVAIRNFYEDCALGYDEVKWKNNGGLFPNYSRYHSERWKNMMGPDDPTVRGRRISQASMNRVRGEFHERYREPIMLALELVDRVRAPVAEAMEKDGLSEAIENDHLSEAEKFDHAEAVAMKADEIGMKAWAEVTADLSVRQKLADLAKAYCEVDASSVELFVPSY